MASGKLLAELNRRGIRLVTVGDKLKVSPVSKLRTEDRDNIRAFKPELLSLLNVRRELEAQFGPVKLITDDRRVVLGGISTPGFDGCQVCADPAGLVVHGRQLCGLECYQKATNRRRSAICGRTGPNNQV
jgi:hypothetical protein